MHHRSHIPKPGEAVAAQCADIQKDLTAAGVGLVSFYRAAGINPSTWKRWRDGGVSPRLDTWGRAQAAAVALIAGVDQPPPPTAPLAP